MNIDNIVRDNRVIAVVCNQWGDTGKGKFSDYFAKYWADVIARGTGGANAGHSVIINGEEVVFHLIPSGITYDSLGKINILGNGMVIDPFALKEELNFLDQKGMSYNNLWISEDANVIMPWHIKKDQEKNKSLKHGGIGSTGRGIGPAYADKIARRGIKFKDLLGDVDILKRKVLNQRHLYEAKPKTYSQREDMFAEIDQFRELGKELEPMIRDTISEVGKLHGLGKKILLEGAQGLLLSVEYGAHPYVTSSDPSIYGTAQGVGLPFRAVDLNLGIAKFPYMTRVGGGPFPSELGGKESENYCQDLEKVDMHFEQSVYHISDDELKNLQTYTNGNANTHILLNSDDEFEQGVGLRLAGREFGATTGRPRRTGWTDLIALKYAVSINGPDLILTKLDVLQGADTIKLCVGYETKDGTRVDTFSRDANFLYNVKPILKEFDGFNEDISQISNFKDLPLGLKNAMEYTEVFTGGNVRIVSTGRKAEQTIIK